MDLQQARPVSSTVEVVKGPKSLFWYLTWFFALGIVAFNTGNLWFQFINKWFPTEVASGYAQNPFSQSNLKFAIASLIVGVPIFFLFAYFIRRALKNGQLDHHSKIRTWISYVILFFTVATAVGDLITTVFKVLDGDFTPRFLLKALTILIITGWIFIYYGLELKSDDSLTNSKTPKIIGIVTVIVILASVAGAFFIIDSPLMARTKAYDQTRTNDLRNISYNVNDYYQNQGALPNSLQDLTNKTSLVDPKTNAPYGYEKVDATSYKLCAVFETANPVTDQTIPVDPYDQSLIHGTGENCFNYKINPAFPANGKPLIEPVPTAIPATN